MHACMSLPSFLPSFLGPSGNFTILRWHNDVFIRRDICLYIDEVRAGRQSHVECSIGQSIGNFDPNIMLLSLLCFPLLSKAFDSEEVGIVRDLMSGCIGGSIV